jgi:hypothetical protein
MNSTTTPIRNLGHMVEVLVVRGSLTSLWPASFGLFAPLNFGACHLFLFLSLAWVLSFYKVWQGFTSFSSLRQHF